MERAGTPSPVAWAVWLPGNPAASASLRSAVRVDQRSSTRSAPAVREAEGQATLMSSRSLVTLPRRSPGLGTSGRAGR